MPRRDQSGPNSEGPMTGRVLGTCGNKETLNVGFGRGRGNGNGNGRRANNFGRNRAFGSSLTIEQEKEYLENRLAEINDIEKK